jgi:hypothetical protein
VLVLASIAVPASSVRAAPRGCDVVGTRGDDVLRPERRGDLVCGLRGDDVLIGGARRDRLAGGRGSDLLLGGARRDRLRGGPGRDGCSQPERSGSELGCEARGFARAGELTLFEPGQRVVGYGYHESLFDSAIGMRPVGRLIENAHPRFEPPPPGDGPGYVVMDPRERGTGPTTAVDIVVRSRSRFRSPVTGTVVAVRRYLLYCDEPDWKIVIRPDLRRNLRVLVLHLAHPRVSDGDHVTAPSSVLGVAARNDEPSAQENRYFPDRFPHVHVEVERNRASPTPGC